MYILALFLATALNVNANPKPIAAVAKPVVAERNNVGDLYSRVMKLEEQNRKLQGRTEDLEYKIKQLEEKNGNLQKSLDESAKKAAELEASSGNVKVKIEDSNEEPAPLTEKKVEIVPESSKPTDSFEEGFNFMTDGYIDEAKKSFESFVKKYPSTTLAGEAYYWLGEIAFDAKDYDHAAINYLKGYKEAPKGTKAPENILKLAQTLKQLGKTAEACENLSRFKTEFKTAHANLKAQAASNSADLKCK